MAFTEKLPEWHAEGIEPPDSKKQSGWDVEDKPPAGWWNWLLNRTFKAIEELRDKAADKQYVDEAVAGVKVPDATLTQKGITQLSSATDSTSEAMAATPKAVKAAMDEALASKQLGVEQKANVVAALNSIGVAASTNETWAQLIAKMAGVIRATGNATAADVLAGKTFSNGSGNGLTGSMPNKGAVVITPGPADQTIPTGYHNGAGKVAGVQFNQNALLVGNTVAGTPGMMPNRSAENFHMPGLESTAWAGDRVFIRPPGGFYDGGSWVTAPVPGLMPGNLRAGVDVLGIVGTLNPKYYASGGGATSPDKYVTISGLSFKPSIVVVYMDNPWILYGVAVDGPVFGMVIQPMGCLYKGSNLYQAPQCTFTSDGFSFYVDAYAYNPSFSWFALA